MIESPYNKIELQLSLLTADEEKIAEVFESCPEILEINKIMANKSEINKAVAADNGIEVIDLINSPNYTKLLDDFVGKQILKLKDLLVDNGLDDKVAWALIAVANGLLD